MAKKKTGAKPPPTPPIGRIELQAAPKWIDALDAAADALGMSRSAYIRMACNRQMNADRREFPIDPTPE